MVSGDVMTVNKKHQKSGQDIKWDKPMILAGNDFPAFVDTSDAICRRVCPFRFEKSVPHKESDPQLDDKIW